MNVNTYLSDKYVLLHIFEIEKDFYMLWKRSLHLTALLCFTFCFGQTQLKVGDISIIGLNCESEDFMFVTFVPLVEGTQIYFTDEEANGSYQIGLGEGTVLYTVPTGGIDRGTVISFQSDAIDFSETSDGMIALANSGDGLIAYQGDKVSEVSVFLDAVGSNVSSLGTFPSGFGGRVLGTVSGQYQGLRVGSNQTSYLVRINDLNEWYLTDAGLISFDLSSFSFDTTPLLFLSKYELLNLGYDFDKDSHVSEVVIQGVYLISEVQVSAPTNFEISLDENGTFLSSLNLNPAMGRLEPTIIYVRLKENLFFGTYAEKMDFTSADVNASHIDLYGLSRFGYKNYCTDLFISEYVEGTSNNKYIEIFNPTINDIILDTTYQLELYSNGSIVSSGVIDLKGRIGSNKVFVIEHPSESLNVSADQQSGKLNFNGNDAIVLKKLNEVLDVVGQVGFDPGIEWISTGCSSGTQDGGIRRKSDLQIGRTSVSDTFNIDEEWECAPVDDTSNLGIHTINNVSKLTIWDGLSWDAGKPDLNDVALINSNYNTDGNGLLEACMLYVSKGVDVEVGGLNPVVLEGDTFLKGSLLVQSSGSFVQKNDRSDFVVTDTGIALLLKQTSILNRWYEYTYWSSPVSAHPIEIALNNSPANRRFYFEAVNFIDLLAEVGNTGVYNSGSDGIDDNGDDWQLASGNMIPGRGYAATMKPTGFTPGVHSVLFTGEFNNGIIEIPVVANSYGAYSDWNFIGNPYPGGLDVSEFFNENLSLLSGAIYLWSHNSEPLSTNSGNAAQNFSNSDYAIITGSGINVAGGDGIIPENYIPSAQGFFVEATNSGNVIFNNSMRAYNSISNSQFFKSSTVSEIREKNVIWLNLTTEFGVFSQIAIGFAKEASDRDDGDFYDVVRKASQEAGGVFYSTINGKNSKYAIQTREAKNLKGQIIPLGVVSNFDSETTFRISLERKQGSFISNSPIYIFDKLNQIPIDLKEEPFICKLQKGTYNDRFELRFKKQKVKSPFSNDISKNKVLLDQNAQGEVRFIHQGGERVKALEIFDVLGRRMYFFENVHSEQYVNISNIKGVFLSKILLENDELIIQKFFKKSN